MNALDILLTSFVSNLGIMFQEVENVHEETGTSESDSSEYSSIFLVIVNTIHALKRG